MLYRILLALLTPSLLWLAWPENGFSPLLFIAFIPLLLLERDLSTAGGSGEKKAGRQWFWYSWLAFGLWNLLGTWWLANAHWSAVVTTVILNGVLMAVVMIIFRFIKNKLGAQRGYIALPFLWICLETLHKDWDFSFPWLNLGNGFAANVEWIQWYEFTGAFGGTLWIWIVNLLFFWILTSFLKNRQLKPLLWKSVAIVLLAISLPISHSYMRYNNYKEKGEDVDIVVVQPNLDTYTEKNMLSNEEQAVKFLRLANLKLSDSVDFLVGPEDLLPNGMYENQLTETSAVKMLQSMTGSLPDLNIVVGATTLTYYAEENGSPTARAFSSGDGFYDVHNSAILINDVAPIELYHKSKLVAGVELMPFANILKPMLGSIVDDMGGSTNSLGIQQEREIFTSKNGRFKVAPLICWESDFGEYVSEFVQNGANLIFVITNDDWWGNTPGYRQHMHYSRLRAIENRRSIARSANTGISCFINQRGDVLQARPYKKDAVIRQTIKANTEFTYYSKAGDLLSRLSLFVAGFLLLYALVNGYLKKVNSKV